MIGSLWAFLAISVLVICTPGPDTALTIRNTLMGGRAAGVATACGVAAGQAIWALATGLGLVAILLASEVVFDAIKLIGAGYLIWLGAQMVVHAFRSGVAIAAGAAPAAHALDRSRALRQGLFSDLGNPKMAMFFASILPQFAPSGDGMLAAIMMLGMLFVAMTFVWLTLYVVVIAMLGGFLQRSWVRRTLDGVTGAALVLFGLKLATVER